MTHVYSGPPPGGLMDVPPSIPNGLLYRCKQILGISKQSLKLVPLSGQTQVSNGQKIIFSLPANSLVDLSTLEFNFQGATQHRGNGTTGGGTGTGTNCSNVVQKAFFPRNTASLIENLEVKVNGQSRQNINQYGYLFNILNDYTCGVDSATKNRIGMNTDPSNKTLYNYGQPTSYRGYPAGNTNDTVTNSWADQDYYTIRQWLGILGGNTSTTIIDTSLYGDITIEITLAPSDVLMLSNPTGTTVSYSSTSNSENGCTFAAGSSAAATNGTGTGYTLSNIGFIITRYDMPSSYYQAVASVLESGAVFKLYYPNYSVFLGTAVALGSGTTTRFNISTQSLDMVISTRQVQDRGINQAPILGTPSSNYLAPVSTSSWGTYGEFGSYAYTFKNALMNGVSKTLNNSKYFVRNGDGISYCTYIVGAVRLIPEYVYEQFNGILRAWNNQNDLLGGVYEGIQSLAHYQTQFYSHILSLNVTNEHDLYTVSGLNASATPISISWEITGSGGTGGTGVLANIDKASTSNGNLFQTSNYNTTPVLFACYTSRLEISSGRNIVSYT